MGQEINKSIFSNSPKYFFVRVSKQVNRRHILNNNFKKELLATSVYIDQQKQLNFITHKIQLGNKEEKILSVAFLNVTTITFFLDMLASFCQVILTGLFHSKGRKVARQFSIKSLFSFIYYKEEDTLSTCFLFLFSFITFFSTTEC